MKNCFTYIYVFPRLRVRIFASMYSLLFTETWIGLMSRIVTWVWSCSGTIPEPCCCWCWAIILADTLDTVCCCCLSALVRRLECCWVLLLACLKRLAPVLTKALLRAVPFSRNEFPPEWLSKLLLLEVASMIRPGCEFRWSAFRLSKLGLHVWMLLLMLLLLNKKMLLLLLLLLLLLVVMQK